MFGLAAALVTLIDKTSHSPTGVKIDSWKECFQYSNNFYLGPIHIGNVLAIIRKRNLCYRPTFDPQYILKKINQTQDVNEEKIKCMIKQNYLFKKSTK